MGELPPDFIDARTAVRIVCGLFFLPHTIAKLRDIERASGFFDTAGLRPPRFFVVLTALLEVTAAFGLISGWYLPAPGPRRPRRCSAWPGAAPR